MKIQARSQVIYILILLAVILGLCSLPFIYVDVSVQSRGILQGNLERHVIQAPVNGRIVQYNLAENRAVAAEEVLLTIAADGIDARQAAQASRCQELYTYLRDLDSLLAGNHARSPQYVAAGQQYSARLLEADNRLQQATADLKRNEPLFREKVIAAAEYEKIALAYRQAQAALELVKREQAASWQAEALKYRDELKELRSNQVQLEQDRQSYTVVAPAKGALQEVTPLRPGSFVFSNQKLADLIPDTGLIALLYIAPKDIGLVRKGQAVKMKIDAFNYNEWGMITGRVTEIAADVTLMENAQQPVFKVKCSLDRTSLQLKNGYSGKLSKGMTLQAGMIITRRNLYQLLYDRVDNWLNPHRQA